MKTQILFCLFFCSTIVQYNQMMQLETNEKHRPVVLFDVKTVLIPGVVAYAKALASKYGRTGFWGTVRNFGELTADTLQYFGVSLDAIDQGQTKLFEFLNSIPFTGQFPIAFYRGRRLPSVMIDWLLEWAGSGQIAQDRINAFIDAQQYVETDPNSWTGRKKSFYKKVVEATFDPETLVKTWNISEQAQHVIKVSRAAGLDTKIIGHCAQESLTLFLQKRTDGKQLFDQFKSEDVLFSHQIADARLQERFSDQWWLQHLLARKQAVLQNCAPADLNRLTREVENLKEAIAANRYVYIDDAPTVDDKRHYTPDSEQLMAIIKGK